MRNLYLTITAVFRVCKDGCLHSPAEVSPYLSAAGQRSRVWLTAHHTPPSVGVKASLQEWVLSVKSSRTFLTGLYLEQKQTVDFRHVWTNATVLNSSPRAPPLCIFRMVLLSLQMFVLFERKCPAKWTSQDIPPWFQFEANVYIPFKVHWSVRDVN